MTTVLLRTNLPDFRRQMQQMDGKLQRRSVRLATSAAGRVLRDAVKRQAALPMADTPSRARTGTLARAVYVARSRRKSSKGVETFVVGVRSGAKYRAKWRRLGRDAFYWRFLEGGWIPRGPGRGFKGGERRRAAQRREAVAGGARRVSYPFIKPAFGAAQGAALDAFVRRMEDEIARLQAGQ